MTRYSFNQDDNKSEWNYAKQWLMRIDSYFRRAGEAAINMQAYHWYHCLLAIYREISTEINKPDDLKELERLRVSIKPRVQKWVYASHNGNPRMDSIMWEELHEFEILLRKIMDKAGLQTRREEGLDSWTQ